ncbi:MAG TPA: mercury(II) reductase [Anaerolineales bacterium]|nr:mercury(II) reductase [Anaerolineales bacterium]
MEKPEDLQELELDVSGMTCDSCAVHVENALRRVPGVRQATVPGWKSGRASVVAGGEIDPAALRASMAEAGYTAAVRTARPARGRQGKDNGGGGDFDLMVIGHGSAGFAAAIKAAELGRTVALVGEGTVGGTCVNIGCVPSKTLIRSLEQHHLAGQNRFRGVHTSAGPIHWPQVLDHKDELVNDMRRAKYLDVLDGYPQITHIQGRALLTGGNRVEVNGVSFAPGEIVIASGARPWAPPIPGLADTPHLDSTSALELRELPRSMIVLGGNAVGLELAQVYARAGVYVTVLELLPRIAPFEDEDISAGLTGYLEDEGLRIVAGLQTDHVEWRGGRFTLTGTKNEAEVSFEAEQLLVATGRRPNTEGLGLEQAGVERGRRGEIIVDDQLRTSNPDIYAAGDVLGRDMFVYVAAYGGTLAAENALAGVGRVYDASYIPRITFTDPQIASAGLTEAQARQQGHEVKVSRLPMEVLPRALAARDTRGFIKLVVDVPSDRLLGAHILAPEAGEIIQTAVLAIRFGLTVSDLRGTMFPYLTNAEGLKLALLALEKDVAMLSCCAG